MIRTILSLLLLIIPVALAGAEDRNRPVYVLGVDGVIGPAYADYLKESLQKADAAQAQLVLIELNTPGGLLDSTRSMATSILESPVPVAVYVTPSGAHAASAGTFLLYAAHIAAMNEGTNVGAATPVSLGGVPAPQDKTGNGGGNQEHLERKAMQDTAAFIRGLAELRGRNAQWAQKAVTESSSLTAEEALKQDVIEYLAPDRQTLLSQLDGREVAVKNGPPVRLELKGAQIVEMKPGLLTRVLTLIADPNVAFILMTIGVYGLILEFYHPGTMVPATIGAICLVLGLYALNIMPVNMAGVILFGLGIAFMAAEVFVPSFGILGIGGFAAFIIGAVIMFDYDAMPGVGLSWGLVIGVGLMGFLITALAAILAFKVTRKNISTGGEGMIGKTAKVTEWSGREGRVEIEGESWQAYSDELYGLTPGDDVLISRVKDLKLKVRVVETGI